ncbi:hypothetical protein [Alicyclobacillus sp. SO9]|nr:hypothetical protein [Alicyclobacillus sp. SO9]
MVTLIILSLTVTVVLVNWKLKVMTKRLEAKMQSHPHGRSMTIK